MSNPPISPKKPVAANPRTGSADPARKRKGLGNPWTKPAAVISIVVLVIAVLMALIPSLFTSQDPFSGDDVALLSPSGTHWFGTDSVGRDLYSRVVYGARETLLGALIAVLVGLIVGTLIGLLAGAQRGWLDTVLMRFVDVLLSIPALLLSLTVIILLGFGTMNAAIAVGITSVATFARLARSQVMTVAGSDFVEAAYGSGGTQAQVLFRHILPNSLTPVLALAALQFGSAILQLSVLGFLGYGAPAPTPEWGLLISDARDYMATSWWLTVLPGFVIIAVVMSANYLSRIIQKEG
ncbi:ABC transporter permease [Corynebacterium suranareeae]|uniref:ABC transporter permease n=1 Tax=Corynebacterium suranareeae TaxID=2506452 RepID=A0A160PRF0_9CORY|nr:ABC transporter permease [Corynebacterium suranareeae]BAU96777.1 ABC transporter permease [Corynebacterium suranareeae]